MSPLDTNEQHRPLSILYISIYSDRGPGIGLVWGKMRITENVFEVETAHFRIQNTIDLNLIKFVIKLYFIIIIYFIWL